MSCYLESVTLSNLAGHRYTTPDSANTLWFKFLVQWLSVKTKLTILEDDLNNLEDLKNRDDPQIEDNPKNEDDPDH